MDPKQTTSLCNSCPKLCRFSCPVSDADRDEATTPWGKMSTMKLVDEGKLTWNPETASLAYKCLQCRASETVCELGNPVPETLEQYRIKAFRTGIAPAPVYENVKIFQNHNNPYPIDLFDKLKTNFPEEIISNLPHSPSLTKRGLGGDSKITYFPGCTEIRYFPETIGKTLKLLRGLKIKISLYQEPILCCGYPLYAAGDLESFRELAEINIPALKRYREVWSSCAECLYTMETLYREMGYKISTQFFHVSEKLDLRRVAGGRAPARAQRVSTGGRNPQTGPASVAYHDPCFLGRYRGVYEAPRKIIESVTGQPPLEFFRNRENSYCCGAGGLLPITSPETSRKITENRLEEFRATGATTLVTACPGCVHQFKKVDPKLDVVSLIDFIAI
ncbi:MAG: (Fe-S)-binding protein [Deltaproteobacteria bacterium]|nr:(Fe-S)-binding protein [Deltaproteobacteria bacterium]